jgi:hypothetical protein
MGSVITATCVLEVATMRVSRELVAAVKLADRPAWRIAVEAGINPTVLSRLLSGYQRPRPGDPRLLRVAEILGVPRERVFEGSGDGLVPAGCRSGASSSEDVNTQPVAKGA